VKAVSRQAIHAIRTDMELRGTEPLSIIDIMKCRVVAV
jgi:hypothetical protein